MKLNYTKRAGGHYAVTIRVPIHLDQESVEAILNHYIDAFGGKRNRKTLTEAITWYASDGVQMALSQHWEALTGEGREE